MNNTNVVELSKEFTCARESLESAIKAIEKIGLNEKGSIAFKQLGLASITALTQTHLTLMKYLSEKDGYKTDDEKFEDFRNNVLTPENIREIVELSKESATPCTNDRDWMASFSATFSLHVLAEYHEWLHPD